MFGRIRRLEISLAAKCQILFGAAVLLIIAAALLVPWRRMEQLTAQLDERTAAALASAGPAPISAPTTGATTPATTESEVPQTSPAQASASQPASRPLAGIVTVDMVSRIDANELLLNRVFILAAGLLAGTLAVV